MELEGQTVLVTGAASGMGRAGALLLAANGARLAVADRNAAGAEATQRDISQAGGQAKAFTVDVSHSSDVDGMVEEVVSAFGGIDVLVHCAGLVSHHNVVELSDDEWRRILSTNLDGTFYVCRAVARHMVERRAGTMVLMTSDRGQLGDKGAAHYAASKGGMIAFAKSLAMELGPLGITVNTINPGTTETPFLADMTEERRRQRTAADPLGRLSQPDEIAQTILFLASRGGKYMTGQVVTTRMR